MSWDYSHFEWDNNKSRANFEKHGVTFEEASTVFDDIYARVISDIDHSGDESRFIILGMSLNAQLLVVCHCYRIADQYKIRIISARKATKNESETYWRCRHEG